MPTKRIGEKVMKLRKLNNNEIQNFFFIHLKFPQETNKDYLYNRFVIFVNLERVNWGIHLINNLSTLLSLQISLIWRN